VFALERWKAKAGKAIRIWLETIGDFEALASLALVAQMNPNGLSLKYRTGRFALMPLTWDIL